MSGSPKECIRCGAPLKKQVVGSNELYYCRKCGCTSSMASVSYRFDAKQKLYS